MWKKARFLLILVVRAVFSARDKQIEGYRARPLFLVYLMSIPILDLFFNLGRNIYGTLAPMYWAIIWGVVTALSMAFFAYAALVNMRMGNLRRGASAMVFGISIGIVIFLLMFFSLQIH